MTFNPAYFYESGKVRVNTYIGGIGASASTKELLATKLGITSSRISNFSIINNNVQCRISGSYILQSSSSLDDTNITYYLDKGGLISNLTQYEFRRAINFNGELILDGVSTLTDAYSNRNGYLVRVICKNATTLTASVFYNGDSPYFRQTFYFPNVTNMGGSTASNSVFYGIMPKSYIYAHPSMATNNAGGPDGDLVAATNAGAIVRYVTDFTLPEPISDVSVGVIHSTSVELIFTEPYAANTIDYYDVYVDGTYNCSCKYGQVYAQGLNPNTTYRIEVYAVDMLFNRSISSVVYATTSSTLGFVSTWDTTKTSSGSSTSTQIKLPLTSNGAYKFSVDWGDGTSNNITGWNDAAATHTYSTAGVYTITITGKCRGWVFDNSGDRLKISSVSSWGTLNIGSYLLNQGGHFSGCANLNLSAVSDQLCLHRVYTLANSFQQCTSLTSINNINTWVMGNIESLSYTFYGNTLFNQELNLFTKYVTNMDLTFYGCSAFNNGLPSGNPGTMSWNTSSATSMSTMFGVASSFNCNIGSWDVSSVSNFYGMFLGASKFNNGGSSSIGSWQTTSATTMFQMFYNATIFNQPLNGWNTQNVTTMYGMFSYATNFNNGLASGFAGTLVWNTSLVTNMSIMFYSATSFNCNVGSWNVSLVTTFVSMFNLANKFNNGLAAGAAGTLVWNTSLVTNMSSMFENATSFNCNVGSWNVSGVTNLSAMFLGASKFDNGGSPDIGSAWTLKTTGTINISFMFHTAILFNQPLNGWNTQAATSMSLMFYGATNFNNGLPSGDNGTLAWNTSVVTSFNAMFQNAPAFNCNVGSWDVSSATSFDSMFNNAYKFNNGGSDTIGNWTIKTTGPVSMYGVFSAASIFNQPLNGWDTSAVINMVNMFRSTAFNNGLGVGVVGTLPFNTSNVTNMGGMFYGTSAFNCSLDSFNVSNVTNFVAMFMQSVTFNNGGSAGIGSWTLKITGTVDMNSMFHSTAAFNQPLNGWNTIAVTDMSSMFIGAIFNNAQASGVGGTLAWNTSNVTNTASMFYSNTRFNQDLSSWDMSKVTNMNQMFFNSSNFNNGLASGAPGTLTWNTIAVTTMNGLFNGATSFNCNVGGWNVIAVADFSSMFISATKFNNGGSPDIGSNWVLKTTGTINMGSMFYGATIFNQPLNGWNTVAVTNMSSTFRSASAFNNGLLSGVDGTLAWNTIAVTTMANMFDSATSFNCNVGSWNVGVVTTFSSMFGSASKFNNGGSTAIETWTLKTSGTINMSFMFYGTTIFNQPLNGWNTVAVTNIALMFTYAPVFNQPLNNWNTTNVTDVNQMFIGAVAFDQDLGSWNVSKVTDFTSFMSTKTQTTFSTANLDAIYNGWSTRPVLPNKSISFGGAKRTAASTSGRAILTSSPNLWTITDGGI